MKNFLLVAINAKYIHSNPAIYSLRGALEESRKPYVTLAEYTINQSLAEILAGIYARKPDVIGFSCYIWNWEMVEKLIIELHKLMPEVDIWLGGPQVSFDAPKLLLQYPQVTGVMIGEGEETFSQLLECYIAGEKDFGKIAGLCLNTGYTPNRLEISMDSLPFLYDDLCRFENRILYYESSRGCPYRCSYCLSGIDKKVRLKDINIVKKELQYFLDHKVKQVKFVDRTFNCNHHHAMEIWSYLKEHDNGVTNFHFEISADILNEEELELLNQLRPGLVQLEIGVQTTNPDTIRAINRVMDVEKLEKVVAQIHEGKNIHQHLDLIAGLPYEDYQSFGRSFNRVYAMKPQQLQLGFLKVLKGSPIASQAEEYGIVFWEKPPYEVLYTKWLSYEDVIRLKHIEEMVETFYNSSQFLHTLSFLEKSFSSAFAMFEAMATLYQEEGYLLKSPARADRYRFLLKVATKYDVDHLDIYEELLIFDMYLRENLKSRPEFLFQSREEKNKEHWELIKHFYQREEQERKYLFDYKDYDWKQMSKMTHLELFSYPVWDMEQPWLKAGEKAYVLFDYQKRNKLTEEASIQIIVGGR